jgi:hypothetical protein
MFDAAALDLGAGEDLFLAGFQQLVFIAAQAALHQAGRRSMRTHVI